ncbi:tetratricopeptide repeat-containing sulfotransferase family protein [Congregibacter litoralis]|uniref:Tetratricopeptide repeat protein/Sulfotransferase domain protein n=1 Tax=Congregibacter litoralis KT71 TaxID=314285 RepID=A4ADX9_9GAMM|nr:sulfotransferase [Congregibacter litoralis]EAQ95789.1 Tetratricopeptide repeat protein/Sulfotransferase domain protein [Congregibacter litoralis KT71]
MSREFGNSPSFSVLLEEASRDLQCGHLSKAKALAERLDNRFPQQLDVLRLLAAISSRSGRFKDAVGYVDRALILDPNSAGLLAHKASSLASLRLFREARDAADHAQYRDLDDSHVLSTLGSVYTKCNALDAALNCFRRAVALAPEVDGHQYNLGTALRFSGEFAAAEKCFDLAIELNPRDYEAYYARSGLRVHSADSNHIREIENALAACTHPWRGEVLLRYALAKELEDMRHWKASFNQLARGARLREVNTRYDVANDVAKMAKLRAGFAPGVVTGSGEGAPSREPFFLLGLPRSGSTLVERILASHSHVTSAGELQNFAIEMMRLVHKRLGTTKAPIDSIVAESLRINCDVLGQAYLDSTRHITGATPHFIDKMPQNFLYIGLIHAALPNAKIIHIKRNAMDACYAMFKTLFKGAYPFSYSLNDLGEYYVAYSKLMEHWERCFPGKIYTVHYEDLVKDQSKSIRGILEFCELPWEDECLTFHQLDKPATTASAVEVRRPIYKSSVHKWEKFRKQLAPLESYLREHRCVH